MQEHLLQYLTHKPQTLRQVSSSGSSLVQTHIKVWMDPSSLVRNGVFAYTALFDKILKEQVQSISYRGCAQCLKSTVSPSTAALEPCHSRVGEVGVNKLRDTDSW